MKREVAMKETGNIKIESSGYWVDTRVGMTSLKAVLGLPLSSALNSGMYNDRARD